MPTSGFVGQDRLTYKVVDSHDAESNAGAVVITVRAASQSVPEGNSNANATSDETANATSASLMSESIGTLAADETPP